jgi:hypothetical protein
VSAALRRIGPVGIGVSMKATSVPAGADSLAIAEIDRVFDQDVAVLDFALGLDGAWLSSLGVMLRGAAFGSGMWFRTRGTARDVCPWLKPEQSTELRFEVDGTRYGLQAAGRSAVLFDDLWLEISIVP